jgi:hypothetical protein
VIVELVLQEFLAKGFAALRKDKNLVSTMFQNLRATELEGIWEFLRDNTIDICLNYPREGVKLPAIVILMKSENESNEFLADTMQPPSFVSQIGGLFQEGPTTACTTTSGRSSVKVLSDEDSAQGGGVDYILASSSDYPTINPLGDEEAYIALVSGTGAGQVRSLVSIIPGQNGFTTISVSPNWDVVPDDTTIFRIQGDAPEISGEPAKIFKKTDIVERIGALYGAQYTFTILSPDSTLLIYLYTILKSLFFVYSQYLMTQGFMNVKISGTDLTPKFDYLPDFAYQRSMLVDFTYQFDVVKTSKAAVAINSINLSLTTHAPNMQDVNDPEITSFNTTIGTPDLTDDYGEEDYGE